MCFDGINELVSCVRSSNSIDEFRSFDISDKRVLISIGFEVDSHIMEPGDTDDRHKLRINVVNGSLIYLCVVFIMKWFKSST